jgi:nicotinate-nucleotide pyrophosphorylase (carboxylating)
MLYDIIDNALKEDIGTGDHSTLSCVPENAQGSARLLIKEDGVLAGVELAQIIFHRFDPTLKIEVFLNDGAHVKKGDVAFVVGGSSRSILTTERLVLNFMQRMSGIATQTARIVELIKDTNTQLLDTRKTTPGIRYMEKWAVRIGGAVNHRFGLYDMIMLKDNHVDYAGGIEPAIAQAQQYIQHHQLDINIEVEVRNEQELNEVIAVGGVQRIMLDNFSPERIAAVLPTIPAHYEIEASGGITIDNIRAYAETGVHFISVGALTHSVKSMDMSLKAIFE